MFFIALVALIPLMSTGLVPPGNYGYTIVNVELPPGRDAAGGARGGRTVSRRLAAFPDVTHMYATIGAARIVWLRPADAGSDVRKRLVDASTCCRAANARETRRRSKLAAAQVHCGTFRACAFPSAPATSARRCRSASRATTRACSDSVSQKVGTGVARSGPHERTVVGEPRAARNPHRAVSGSRRRARRFDGGAECRDPLATSGDVAMSLPGVQPAEAADSDGVRLNDDARGDVERIRSMLVPGRAELIPLENVARVSFGAGPQSISRSDRSRSVTISAGSFAAARSTATC